MFLLRCLSSFYKRDIQSSVVGSSAFQEIKNTINIFVIWVCLMNISVDYGMVSSPIANSM